MARKSFKTVSGYLRSKSDDLCAAQARAKRLGQTPMSDADGAREILNNLLPQLGLGLIAISETPLDGIKRLQPTAQDDRQTKALSDCLKWLKKPRIVSVHTHGYVSGGARASHETGGMILGGESFTAEETKQLEEIQRSRGVSMTEAVRIWRGAA